MSGILGLDYGSKYIGVAYTDTSNEIIFPIETIKRDNKNSFKKVFKRIKEIVINKNVNNIILGTPLRYDSSNSDMSLQVMNFKKKLEEVINLNVTLVDERLTTYEADEFLKNFKKIKDRKQYVDQVAAVFILQEYINNKSKYNKKE